MKRRPDRGGSDCFALLSADELVALRQLVGLQDVDKMSHGCQCSLQPVGAYLGFDPDGERPFGQADAAYRPITGFSAGQ